MSEFSFPLPQTQGETQALQIEHVGGIEVDLSPTTRKINFEVGDDGLPLAIGYTDVDVRGLWHLSRRQITHFHAREAPYNRHGTAAYLGAGLDFAP